jgi:hypothetical protein
VAIAEKLYKRSSVDCDLTVMSFCMAWANTVNYFGGEFPTELHLNPGEVADWAINIAAPLRAEGFDMKIVPDPDCAEYEWWLSRGGRIGYGSPGA